MSGLFRFVFLFAVKQTYSGTGTTCVPTHRWALINLNTSGRYDALCWEVSTENPVLEPGNDKRMNLNSDKTPLWEMWEMFSSNQTDTAIWDNRLHWDGGKGWGRWAWAISPHLALLWPHILLVASYCVHIMFIPCIFISQGDLRSVPLCKLENNDLKLLRPSLTKSPRLNKVEKVPGDEMSHGELFGHFLLFSSLCGLRLIYTFTNSLFMHIDHFNCRELLLKWIWTVFSAATFALICNFFAKPRYICIH